MSDINSIDTAEGISQKIFEVVSVGEIEKEMILKILNDWNESWIAHVADLKMAGVDNSEDVRRTNDERLRKRMNQLKTIKTFIPAKLREDTV